MEQMYDSKMKELGYNQLVCDIFTNWEDVKDEILPPDRKQGTGNGTVHVFLGAADSELRKEFPAYYENVSNGEDTAVGAVKVKHYFLATNVLSMLGYICRYYFEKNTDFNNVATDILRQLDAEVDESGFLTTESFFKLSTGASKLRPYFKQFDEKGVFHKIIRHLLLPNSSYKISLFKNEEGEYAALWLIGFNYLSNFEADSNDKYTKKEVRRSELSLQQIFYGAPGTGKSNTIKRTVDDQGKICFRTTFHPDSDYSTFVGCYKPTMKRSTITKDGVTTREEKIVYRFEPQAFTNAYVQAWKSKEEVYLVIEEINRGNCAQIFGDLFQLLDRKNGESEYPINADTALADYLQVALADSNRDDIPTEVKSGMKLKLPSNLYIWATMNTSDQSLFPIDSAFKRRWDWTYIPIKQHDEGYRIKIDPVTYDWWGFLEKINQVIGDTTSSEDKKLGYFFVKAEGKEIGADKFVSKVLFYLWNDVFKNYGFDNPIFSRGENKKFAFSDFFKKDGTPETSVVNQFLRKLDETIDKENSFEKIPDVNDAPSSLMVKYNGESIEGTSARNKYVELVKFVVAEKGGEQVANCIGAELTRTPAEGSTRMYKPIGDTGWYLATNNGIDAIKKNINKIKEALGVDIEIE